MRVSKFYFTLLLFILCWNLIFCMLTRNKGHKQPKQLRRSERSKAHVDYYESEGESEFNNEHQSRVVKEESCHDNDIECAKNLVHLSKPVSGNSKTVFYHNPEGINLVVDLSPYFAKNTNDSNEEPDNHGLKLLAESLGNVNLNEEES
uniref:Uncharacterized protein n=1 Tax=Meloidogyne enterolobii TaxID=390850 RepID=A0A6V7WAZ8_MELEN|nr:unnamed protein product [Meloidogyne enterolobii]